MGALTPALPGLCRGEQLPEEHSTVYLCRLRSTEVFGDSGLQAIHTTTAANRAWPTLPLAYCVLSES